MELVKGWYDEWLANQCPECWHGPRIRVVWTHTWNEIFDGDPRIRTFTNQTVEYNCTEPTGDIVLECWCLECWVTLSPEERDGWCIEDGT